MFMLGSFAWACLLFPIVLLVATSAPCPYAQWSQAYAYSLLFDKLRRRAVDFFVALWAKGAMTCLLYWPKLEGRENLLPANEVHPAIDPKDKDEKEILRYVFDSVNQGLPEHQKTEKLVEQE
ncbi:hypothetical protein GUITHDRAFT_109206 [Guillardia theta CCMP2712]|uniref:Uncharacterized protein n=1 Tax=Guillardia theta (strain CCMP2712) TaxID=905079 RepID=L1J8D8_GUITC|nr:hypothetical protein GUITHDRAFT_109206 [Guillardia theta CCMP2712]EKX44781.1 hypothetical protein GUITHDRAFT_109206 [Guillardia theta CCMP2712]|eukprot:XP_005831761.1 hypothetical protein GUITHDRAFT_109206 [Guillardia theta CCMP2712]